MATLDELLKRQQRQAQQPKSFISDLKPPGMAGETPAYAPEYPPPTFGKPPPQQRSGALGTVGREIAAVGAETLSGLAGLANQVAGTSYTLPGAAERNINDPLGDFAKRMRAGQAENVERGRQAISEAEGVGGTLAALAQNPAAVGTMVAGQLPLLAGAVGAAGLAGRVGRSRALAGGASPATAEAAAQQAARQASIGTSGGMGAGFAGEEAAGNVQDMKPAELQRLPAYQQLRALGASDEEARRELANRARFTSATTAAPLSALGGAAGAPFEAALATGSRLGGRQLAAGVLGQVAEEAVQEGAEQFASNYGVSQVDPNQALFEGVPEAATIGGVLGGLMGGGLSGVGAGAEALRRRRDAQAAGGGAEPGPTAAPAPPGPAPFDGEPPTPEQQRQADFLQQAYGMPLSGGALATVGPLAQAEPLAAAAGDIAPFAQGELADQLPDVATGAAGQIEREAIEGELERPGLPAPPRQIEREQATRAAIDAAAERTDVEPTEAKKEAGNYAKGRVNVNGLPISIENPMGSSRRGRDDNGNEWSNEIRGGDYGYIRGSKGRDGDQVDVFLGPRAERPDLPVYVVDQVNPRTGEPDESKLMLGYDNPQQAADAYNSNYSDGWQGLGSMYTVLFDDVKRWARSKEALKMFGESNVDKTDVTQEVNPDAKRRRDSASERSGTPTGQNNAPAAENQQTARDGNRTGQPGVGTEPAGNQQPEDGGRDNAATGTGAGFSNEAGGAGARAGQGELDGRRDQTDASGNIRATTPAQRSDDNGISDNERPNQTDRNARGQTGQRRNGDLDQVGNRPATGTDGRSGDSGRGAAAPGSTDTAVRANQAPGDTTDASAGTGSKTTVPPTGPLDSRDRAEGYIRGRFGRAEALDYEPAKVEGGWGYRRKNSKQQPAAVPAGAASEPADAPSSTSPQTVGPAAPQESSSEAAAREGGAAAEPTDAQRERLDTLAAIRRNGGDPYTVLSRPGDDALYVRNDAKSSYATIGADGSIRVVVGRDGERLERQRQAGELQPLDQAQAEPEADQESVADKIIADTADAPRYNDDGKVLISDAFDAYRKKNPDVGIDDFKEMLWEQHKAGDLRMSRSDLPQSLDQEKRYRSQFESPGGSEFHFVRLPQTAETSSPAPQEGDAMQDGQLYQADGAPFEMSAELRRRTRQMLNLDPSKPLEVYAGSRTGGSITFYNPENQSVTIIGQDGKIRPNGTRADLDRQRERIASGQRERLLLSPPSAEPDGRRVPPPGESPTGDERRLREQRRRRGKQRTEDLTTEQKREALLVDPMTGLGTRLAFEQYLADNPNVAIASIDADSLKWLNDNMAQDAGDLMLERVGRVIGEVNPALPGFHISGDEYYIVGRDPKALANKIARVQRALSRERIQVTKPDGTVIEKQGLEITAGIGYDKPSADAAMKRTKKANTLAGKRYSREAKEQPELLGPEADPNVLLSEPPGVQRSRTDSPPTSAEVRQLAQGEVAADMPAISDTVGEYLGAQSVRPPNTPNDNPPPPRIRVEAMTDAQLTQALLVDPMTGLGTRRAFEERLEFDPPAVLASIDADSLKWINDNMSQDSGDLMLAKVGEAIRQIVGVEAGYHISGDEFYVAANTNEAADAALAAIETELAAATISATKPDGEVVLKTGLEVTYGLGPNKADADQELKREKRQRTIEGRRFSREAIEAPENFPEADPAQFLREPPGISRQAAGRDRDNQRGVGAGPRETGSGSTQAVPGVEQETPAVAPSKKKNPREIDPANDDLFTAIAKLGGIERAAAEQTFDPAELKAVKQPVFGMPVFRAKGKGDSVDGMAEKLSELGYFDTEQTPGENALLDLIQRQLDGRPVFTAAGLEAQAEQQYQEQFDPASVFEEPFEVSADDLADAGYADLDGGQQRIAELTATLQQLTDDDTAGDTLERLAIQVGDNDAEIIKGLEDAIQAATGSPESQPEPSQVDEGATAGSESTPQGERAAEQEPEPQPDLRPENEPEPQPGRQESDDPIIAGGLRLADDVAKFLQRAPATGAKRMDWRDFIKRADKAYGGTQGDGAYQTKQAYDAIELGFNRWLLRQRFDGATARKASAAVQLLPTQTRRSEEQIALQQFSTPPAHSFAMAWLANIGEGDVVLEPSAGTGNLASWALLYKPQRVIANELSDTRRGLLGQLVTDLPGYNPDQVLVTGHNAMHINALLEKSVAPSVVVMNPPFSADVNRRGKKDLALGWKHLTSALERLQDGGRAVVLLGRGMSWDKPRTRKLWRETAKNYNIRAVVDISGENYKQFGTSFDNVVAVIDKTGPTQGKPVTGKVDYVDDLFEKLSSIRNDRQPTTGRPGQPTTAQPASGAEATPGGRATGQDATGSARTDAVGSQQPTQPPANTEPGAATGDAGTAGDRASGNVGTAAAATARPGRGTEAATSARDGVGSGGRSTRSTQRKASAGRPDLSDALSGGNQLTPTRGRRKARQVGEGRFDSYAPTYEFNGAQPHPGSLAESGAMATIRPPELTYQPDLPQAAIDTGRISEAQLEVVAYAGQAHSRMLPDGKTRRGYFVGDGTGLGKGTEMAAIILDNWRQGRRKAVWVSENAPLFKDAQRDAEWTGLGKKTIFQPPAADAAIERDEGVLYTTYSQLSTTSKGKKDADGNVVTAPKRRLDQFVEWLGEDFDGVIAFDEAHNMRSAVSVKGKRGVKDASQAALAGIELQQRLPNARVVYASATGATEVMNLGYTERLGLWGEGTPFPKKEDFISDIDAGGVAAMEVVAKDLKAMGMYQARSLSFDGVEYDTLTHGLSANQRQMYDTLAEAWQKILVNIDDAMESSGSAGDGRARAAANSSFWSAQQRFFNQILTALQTPTVIKDIEKQLKAGNSTVMQIVNTDEALAKRRLSQAAEAGMALDQVDLTPRDIIMQFLAQGFPTTLYEQYTDEDGNNRTRPVLNEDDSPVEDPQAVAKRDKLMEEIALLDVPDGALNQIIRHFGPDQVAEITGRSQRVTWNADGEPQLQKFTNSQKDKDARAFERGDKRILIFSDAGGTGRSYHASLGFENQQKRIHYLLQPGWRADKAVQGLGRTHRTNQAQPPRYVLVTTDLVAQKRFMSSIARRLDQLGALTRGQRDTSSQGLFSAENNLENEYGARAANRFLDAIYADRLTDIAPRAELAQQLGLRLYDSEGKRRIMSIEVPQFLNRLLSLKPDMMEKVFDEFQSYVQQQVDYAREVGEYDTGMQDLKAQKIEIANRQLVAEHAQGGTTEYVKLAVTNPAKLNRWKNFSERALKGNRFIKNRRSGKVYAVEPPGRVTNPRNGDVILRAKRIGVNSVSYGRPSELLDESKVQSLTVDEAKALWDEQIKTAPQTVTEDVHLISGALLPIYDRLPDDQPKIIRVEASGERLLGREIPAKKIKQTLKSLGVNSAVPKLSLQQWADAVLNDAVTVELANGLTVKQSTVYGEKRLEVVPKEGSIDRGQLDQLKNQGAVSEIIAYRPRVFLPKPRAAAIMQRMTNNNPIVDYEGSLGTDPEALYSRRAGGGDQSTVDSVQAELRQAFGRRVERLGNVNYVQSVADLPASANAPADTQGLWHRGQIYLVADKILPGSAQGVLLHELVHADLRTNPAYSELMDAVRAASRRPDSPFADALNRVPDDTPARFVAEETLAYAAESNPKLGLVRRLVAMVRNALRKLGLIRGYSDNDLLNYAIDALRRQARGQDAYSTGFDADTVTGATTTADGIASGLFSRAQDPNPDTAEQLLREIDSAYRQRPTLQERVGNIGEWFSNLPAQSRRAWMNLLTRQQIVDLGKDQLPLAERFEQYARRMDADAQAMIQENYDLTSRWSKRLSNFAGKQSQDQVRLMSHTMHEATLAGIDPDKPRKGDKDKDGYDKVMRLWNGMDEQSKEIYRETRDAYKNRREQLERALVMRLANLDAADPRIPKDRNAFYDYAIDVMSQQEGGATRRQILTNMRIQFESSKVEPYFPLSRFGDWYIAATGPDGERSYMMYETEREWKRAQKDLAAEGYELRVGKNVRNLANDNGPGAGFMRQIFDTMDESDIGATAADLDGLKDDLYQLYLMSLPEQSIRKRFIHRKGTRGFSQDALRAFAHHMGHSAKQIARLRYGHTMGDQLSAMKANIEAAPDPAKAADIVQGLQSSYEWMMNPNTATWANRATSIGFVWYLGVSPAAAAVNLTQTAVVTLPVLGAQYGFAKSSKALGKATADYTRYVEKNIRAYGAEKLRNPEAAERLRAKARQQFFKGDEGRMLDELENSGAIDRTLTASVLGLDEGNVDTRQAWQWAMGKVGFLFHQAERWNRETTALAAYRLARDAGKDHERAVTAAYDAIFQSHFDYSSGNRAAFMRGNLPRVFLLFRQYSQNMTYLMGRTLQQSVAGESPEKRREAMKTLGGVLTMTAIMGGAMGLPLFSIVTSAMQMAHDLGDDSDEPYDAELEIRNWLNGIFGEGAGARVARGVFGAGIGTRVSLNELWLRSPNRDLEGKELAGYWLEQAAGPVVGIGINGMRGVDLMTDGQIYRGFETVVPKFVRDVMRGWRYSEEGVRSLRGDEVVGRGDLSTLELFMQAGGITPHQIIERYDQNSALKRAEQKVLNRRRSLMNRYYMAYRDGDRETLRETLQLMQRFNRANPVIAISADSIRRSLRSRARYSGRAQDGIILDRRLRQQLLEQRYVQ